MKPTQLEEFLNFSISKQFPVLITGKPGIGKTDIVHSACLSLGARLIVSHPVVSDPTDFKGLPFPDKDGKSAHFLPFGDLLNLIEAQEPTVFFMDDLGQAPPSVQAAAMQLILARHINGHKVSDNVTFIAATNRREDKAGVAGILEPVKSRFASIVELEVNTDDWVRWALTTGNMPTELIAFMRFKPDLIDKFTPTKDMTNSPSPRTITHAGKLQNAGLPKALEFEVYKGAAGEAFAAEYTTFLKLFRELPNIDGIILDPKGSAVPQEAGTRYALAGALASRMNDQNIGAILTYLKRLSTELSVVTVKDARIRNREIQNTRAFTDWASEHQNVLM